MMIRIRSSWYCPLQSLLVGIMVFFRSSQLPFACSFQTSLVALFLQFFSSCKVGLCTKLAFDTLCKINLSTYKGLNLTVRNCLVVIILNCILIFAIKTVWSSVTCPLSLSLAREFKVASSKRNIIIC